MIESSSSLISGWSLQPTTYIRNEEKPGASLVSHWRVGSLQERSFKLLKDVTPGLFAFLKW